MSPFPTTARLAAAAAVAACALAAPAHAAYAPRMSLQVEPPTAGGPVAMSLELSQAPGEEATRTLRVSLLGFGSATEARSRPACTGAAATSGACPAESRIGSATSTTSFGTFSGGIFHAGSEGELTRVLAVLSNPAIPLVLDQRFTGTLSPVPGGRELAFDDLPGATATRLRIALDGDDRALVTAPAACGERDVVGRLTSHGGQRAEQTSRVAIGGCAGARPA
ncbi:MAG TPA: hypothetical protein VNB64_05845, partial [Solirubrobacteraceae bacterium]|nr:hypothetical protein [Solirubrobacteraceae bacterium]